MKQHIIQDPALAEYSVTLDALWTDWEPWLRTTERLLHVRVPEILEYEDATEVLRRAQYHAHTASEIAMGMRPPLPAADAHEYLIASLSACRDTLGAIAMRTETDELDEQTAEIGWHAIANTREAFQAARYSSMAAYAVPDLFEPVVIHVDEEPPGPLGVAIWSLTGVCAVLFVVLIFELVLLTPA